MAGVEGGERRREGSAEGKGIGVGGAWVGAYGGLLASIEDAVASLDAVDRAAAAARMAEDRLEVVHDLLEHRYGIGLISDWTTDFPVYEGPVVAVRLAVEVLDEDARHLLTASVDELLCQSLDADRFALLSTRLVLPGARGSARDPQSSAAPPPMRPSIAGTGNGHDLRPKRQALRDRVVGDLDRYLEALDAGGDRPRQKDVARVHKRQERFEGSLYRLHTKMLKFAATPLITTWAYMWDELPWSGPGVVLAVFDVADGHSDDDVLSAIAEALNALPADALAMESASITNV